MAKKLSEKRDRWITGKIGVMAEGNSLSIDRERDKRKREFKRGLKQKRK